MKCIIFQTPPIDFLPKIEVASCYCEWEDKILLLKRHTNKSQGDTWGVPAGKLEASEDALTALVRELLEELNLKISKNEIQEIGKLYIREPNFDFIFHMFHKSFDVQPDLVLEVSEHQEFRWATLDEAFKMPLMAGEAETLTFYKKFMEAKNG